MFLKFCFYLLVPFLICLINKVFCSEPQMQQNFVPSSFPTIIQATQNLENKQISQKIDTIQYSNKKQLSEKDLLKDEIISKESLTSSSSNHYSHQLAPPYYGDRREGYGFVPEHGLHHSAFGSPDFHFPEHYGVNHFAPPHHGDIFYNKAIALKSILIPLAGVALLGAAATLITNPVLLQLGVVSGKKRRRRRRSIDYKDVYPENIFIRPQTK